MLRRTQRARLCDDARNDAASKFGRRRTNLLPPSTVHCPSTPAKLSDRSAPFLMLRRVSAGHCVSTPARLSVFSSFISQRGISSVLMQHRAVNGASGASCLRKHCSFSESVALRGSVVVAQTSKLGGVVKPLVFLCRYCLFCVISCVW
jgi:hypothetical protein